MHGFARGRTIGYPTANLAIKDFIHLPSTGVYTVDVLWEGQCQRGFASIGYNETFNGKEKQSKSIFLIKIWTCMEKI